MHLKRWENVSFVFWNGAIERRSCLVCTLTAFALYVHACYNIEILIKLLTLLLNVDKHFYIFVPFLRF